MKNHAKSYRNANRENVNAKRREKYCKDCFLKKRLLKARNIFKACKTSIRLCLCCL